MTLTKEKKKELITQYQKNKNDTGSSEVQVSILTERISNITEHLAKNSKDYQSQRGLLLMVGKRKKHLKYLEKENTEGHRKIIEQLGLRG